MVKNLFLCILALSFAAVPADAKPIGSMVSGDSMDSQPASMKGKRITFFFKGCQCLTPDSATGAMVAVPPSVTLRYVNFNYGNTSNGKNGGSMTYSISRDPSNGSAIVTLKDIKYSGSGYRLKGNPKGDSGEWVLFFESDDYGSASFTGTENGKPVEYNDVAFAITPVSRDAKAPTGRSSSPTTPPKPGRAGVAPESMAGKVITVMPRAGQHLAQEGWALREMQFGRDHIVEGRRVNHLVDSRGFDSPTLQGPNWMNAFMGESECVRFPGYTDYSKQPDGTARIQLSGESSANAYYILHFDSPTSGTITYHHEDYDEDLEVLCHIEGIPFKVTGPGVTPSPTPARTEDPKPRTAPKPLIDGPFKVVE